MGWPLETDDLEDEDLAAITYDWDPEELGIPADRLRDLQRLQQMRPLTTDQPWGVFFLEFAGSRLPITQVRRLLGSLVKKKRATGGTRGQAWRLDDLLFIVITGVDDSMQLHLLAFSGGDPRSAGFLPLAWRPVQSPDRHLRRLAEELLPRLAWPDDESDRERWRSAWREPFKLPIGQTIKDAARLAERMAKTARDLRDQIGEALKGEQGSGPFSTLMEEIRTQLVSDVDAKRFADMCAQTLVYGVLSSRVTDPKGFGSSPVFSTVPLANPFLEAFFEQVHDEAALLDLPGSGLPQLVADLRRTNVEAILDQFGSTAKGGDPVIHFYEEFLKQYDRKLRADAGAFYTPQPVVECMVRLVDEVLRSRFGLPLGIADPSSWAEVAERNGFPVPDGVNPDKPFVSMIDPATGTGTFLIEWICRARQSFLEFHTKDEWPQHLRNHVLLSMHAFELMLAPYAIAHLKVALELHNDGVNDGETQIMLTDTLDHAGPQGQLDTMVDPITKEGERAFKLKKKSYKFTVIIGNPPYDREQRAAGDTSRRKGGVVRHGVPGIDPLIKTITEPMKTAGQGIHLKNIYNDYVYFWRWAVWQATELPSGPGIVAFISASSYLEGKSMGGVRDMLRKTFDELWIADLGGEGRGVHTEPNIFDILTPVAISIGVRTGKTKQPCVTRYLRVTGVRKTKLVRLKGLGIKDITAKIVGKDLDYLIPRRNRIIDEWPQIDQIFPWVWTGCEVKRTWPIGETKSLLEKKWQRLMDEIPRHRNELLRKTGARHITATPIPLLSDGPRLRPLLDLSYDDQPEGIERYGYRSFDRQWIIADHRLADAPKRSLWHIRGQDQVYLTTLTTTYLGYGPVLTVSPYVPDRHHFRGSYGSKNTMPFYFDHEGNLPNVTHGLLKSLSQRIGLDILAEDILAYVYALGGTSAFSERFTNELAEVAEPVYVPITLDILLFKRAVVLGRDLLWWHTWGERFAPAGVNKLPVGRIRQFHPVNEMPDSHSYDSNTQKLSVGTGLFGPVSSEVWNFEVSGLRVVKSWLDYRMKARKGKKSSPLDNIRPDRWTQTDELLRLLAILEHTVEVTPVAAELLGEIISGPLILAKDLPQPTDAQRKPPKL